MIAKLRLDRGKTANYLRRRTKRLIRRRLDTEQSELHKFWSDTTYGARFE